jgi:tetratricopeptide (TPR) repeat protein
MSLTKSALRRNITQTDQYQTLLRALRRRKGFGIQFVQCSPGQAKQLIQSLKQDLPQKNLGLLNLEQPIENLFDLIQTQPNHDALDILFIQGIEKSLEPYIKPGYGGVGDYYKLDTVPPILNHVNQQRENFRDRFSHLCFVFIVPLFALKYFIHRAPDFFDWRSGIFKFIDNEAEELYEATPLNVPRLHVESSKLDDYEAWLIAGIFLGVTERYEEAIASYDKALQIKSDDYEALLARGFSLHKLGRYEEAIASYDKALQIEPNYYEAWDNRGIALGYLGRYEEAITSYDKALQIQPDASNILFNRACAYARLANFEAALENLSKAIALNPDKYLAMAKIDSDFDAIREDERFQALVQG